MRLAKRLWNRFLVPLLAEQSSCTLTSSSFQGQRQLWHTMATCSDSRCCLNFVLPVACKEVSPSTSSSVVLACKMWCEPLMLYNQTTWRSCSTKKKQTFTWSILELVYTLHNVHSWTNLEAERNVLQSSLCEIQQDAPINAHIFEDLSLLHTQFDCCLEPFKDLVYSPLVHIDCHCHKDSQSELSNLDHRLWKTYNTMHVSGKCVLAL